MSELAEKIKALKAAHNIEAAPQRLRQKQSSAEEPVTARIRRRTQANPVSGEAVEADGELGTEENSPPASAENSASKPPMTFQERVAMERRSKDEQPSVQ